MTTAQAMVIGGGIAGAAAATHLARAGRGVVLLESKAIPCDKVCGEFVSDEAARYLHDLDIDLDRLGAVRIFSVRLYTEKISVSTSLPFTAFSLSRRVLDEAVLRRAEASGAEVRRGRAVRSLQSHGRVWVAELKDGSKVSATDVFLATGKHDLRGWKRESRGEHVAFKLHWFLNAAQAAALGSCVELFFFPGGYAGLELVENAVAFCEVRIQMGSAALIASLRFPGSRPKTFRCHASLGSPSRDRLNSLRIRAKPWQGTVVPWRSGRRHSVVLWRRHRNRAPLRAAGRRFLSFRRDKLPIPIPPRTRHLRPGPGGNAHLTTHHTSGRPSNCFSGGATGPKGCRLCCLPYTNSKQALN